MAQPKPAEEHPKNGIRQGGQGCRVPEIGAEGLVPGIPAAGVAQPGQIKKIAVIAEGVCLKRR